MGKNYPENGSGAKKHFLMILIKEKSDFLKKVMVAGQFNLNNEWLLEEKYDLYLQRMSLSLTRVNSMN
jgi:hypothetical protein